MTEKCTQPQAHPERCGCAPAGTEQVSSVWLSQLRDEHRLFGAECVRLRSESERLERERVEQWRLRRDAEADRDTNAAVIAELRAELKAVRGALSDLVTACSFSSYGKALEKARQHVDKEALVG